MNHFVGPDAGDTIANRAYQRGVTDRRAAIEAMAIDGATLTLTPGVVLEMRADELGKMIQARVRAGGLAVIRIEELATVADRLGIPLSELDGTSPTSALSGTAA